MNIEKQIRSQAKEALNGNWTAVISGFFVICGALVTAYVFTLAAGSLFNIWTEDGLLKRGCDGILTSIVCISVLIVILLSPFKNGFLKICYETTNGRKADFSDIFYFFKGNKYLNTLQFNLLIAVRIILNILIGLIPYFIFSLITYLFSIELMPTVTANEVVFIIKIVLISIGIAFAIINSSKYYLTDFLYIDNDGDTTDVFKASKAILKVHKKSLRKLFLSFVFWLALCFFIIPSLYVVPYMTTSFAQSSKWLIILYKEGKLV